MRSVFLSLASRLLPKGLSLLGSVVFCLRFSSARAVNLPSIVGLQTPENHHLPSFKEAYATDFEDFTEIIPPESGAVSFTTDPSRVIQGSRSLRLGPPSSYIIPADKLNLEPGATYTLEFSYVLENPSATGSTLYAAFTWPGLDPAETLSGPPPGSGARGVQRLNIRLPENETDFEIVIGCVGGFAVIDELSVYKLSPLVYPAAPNLLRLGFPRLSNFHVYSSQASSVINNQPIEKIRDILSRYDMVNGIAADHTLGAELDYHTLKLRNPDIILLPYLPTFLSVLHENDVPVGGSAGILKQFNTGLEEAWFMKNPSGQRLSELLYPSNFQMNHTAACPLVDGLSFPDYLLRFIRRTVLPTGYWEGIHFDQSEWYPNPLLGNGDPFNQTQEIQIALDSNNDHQADTATDTYRIWRDSFFNFFDTADAAVGQSALFFGNAGEMTANQDVMRRLNGFQYEFFSPYRRTANESYATDHTAGWYRYLRMHQLARTLLRAPQIPSTQMTGVGLGVQTGESTGNGVPNRTSTMTSSDYNRARFGLASALMTDGFFGYTFADNQTSPTVWLDEFSVNPATGIASNDGNYTKYLGQPLGDPVELPYAQTVIASVDFEGGALPTGFYLPQELVVTSDPAIVLSGSKSGVVSFSADPLDPEQAAVLFYTDPQVMKLAKGSVYHLLMEYRIVSYNPVHFNQFLTAAVADFANPASFDDFGSDSLYSASVNVGQKGQLHAAIKLDSSNYTVAGFLSDSGTVVVDQIKLIKGSGGAYRRDFEGGVALVNPTAVAQTVTTAQAAGPLGRTGLKRISGRQTSTVNNGQSVSGSITIAPANGIILLANKITAPAPKTPLSLAGVPSQNAVQLAWTPVSGGTVSGYVINYGVAGGDLTSFKTVGLTTSASIGTLQAGTSYSFRIASHDYLGNLSPYSSTKTIKTTGAAPSSIPTFTVSGSLVLGQPGEISGTQLASGSATFGGPAWPESYAGSQVLINGIPASLLSVTPTKVRFLVPSNLGGTKAIVRVTRGNATSPSRYATVAPL